MTDVGRRHTGPCSTSGSGCRSRTPSQAVAASLQWMGLCCLLLSESTHYLSWTASQLRSKAFESKIVRQIVSHQNDD